MSSIYHQRLITMQKKSLKHLETVGLSIALFICCLLIIFYENIIPESFQRDHMAFINYINVPGSCWLDGGKPYCFTVGIYAKTSFLLFGHNRIALGFIQVGVALISLFIFRYILLKKYIKPSLQLVLFEIMTMFLLTLYLSIYSKEFFIFVLLILPVMIILYLFNRNIDPLRLRLRLRSKASNPFIVNLSYFAPDVLIILVLLINAYLFKEYYIIWAGFYIVICVFWRKRHDILPSVSKGVEFISIIKRMLLAYFVSVFGLAVLSTVFMNVLGNKNIISMRTMVFNKLPSSSTRIDIFHFNNIPIIEVPINCIHTVISLLFPIRIFIHPSLWRFFAFVVLMSLTVLCGFILKKAIMSYQKASVIFFVAFIMVSSVFEPDYGSYFRHLSLCFPILLYMLWTSQVLEDKA